MADRIHYYPGLQVYVYLEQEGCGYRHSYEAYGRLIGKETIDEDGDVTIVGDGIKQIIYHSPNGITCINGNYMKLYPSLGPDAP